MQSATDAAYNEGYHDGWKDSEDHARYEAEGHWIHISDVLPPIGQLVEVSDGTYTAEARRNTDGVNEVWEPRPDFSGAHYLHGPVSWWKEKKVSKSPKELGQLIPRT